MQDIIQNGLNSIRVGLEDFELADRDAARLTSAVRNLYAGILILAKGKLYELSPPDSQGILIRVVKPKLVNQQIELVPQGRKTIGYDELKSRCEHFRLKLDWTKVERIGAIRNDLEHFYHGGAPSNVREAVADAATVIRSLLDLLHLDPVNDLGQRWWDILLRNQKLFDEELAACRATFDGMNWLNEEARAASAHFSCTECQSPLIRQADADNQEQLRIAMRCAACGADCVRGAVIEGAILKLYFGEMYEAQTRGGELPFVRCPACRHDTLVMDLPACAACGFVPGPQTAWCDTCHNPLSDEEQRTGTHECPAFYAA